MNAVFSKPSRVLLVIFYCLCFTTLICWSVNDSHPLDGDEPHYLVMANGIVKYRTFEQTLPYLEEFKTREMYSPGLAEKDAIPSPANSHTIIGPNGLYNAHNVGLPLFIAVPFKLGGIVGVKVFLILISGLIVRACWAVSGSFTNNTQARVLSVAAVTLGLPLIPAVNQIYPDILAGMIALIEIASLLCKRCDGLISDLADLSVVLAISFLPWLHIKFSAAALILLIAICWNRISNHRAVAKSLTLIIPFCASLCGLALYNIHAFGNPSGPYQGNALEVSSHSLMVFVGLYIDQFQGMLLQNPALLAGILFAAPFLKRNYLVGLTTLAVHLSFLAPNALHPNWYGGVSFAGRFGWSGAIVLMPIAIFGLVSLRENLKSKSYYLFFLIFLIQANSYIRYTFKDMNLYNAIRAFPEYYPSFIPELRGYTPILYDSSWAYSYAANIVFSALLCGLLVVGIVYSLTNRKLFYRYLSYLSITGLLLIVGSGLVSSYPRSRVFYEGVNLPSIVGVVENNSMSATEGNNSEGFLTFGPYIKLPSGQYKFTLSYDGFDPDDSSLGWWDISSGDEPFATGEILSSDKTSAIEVEFKVVEALADSNFEMRTFWEGEGRLSVHSISIEKM